MSEKYEALRIRVENLIQQDKEGCVLSPIDYELIQYWEDTRQPDKLFSGRVRMCEVDVSQNIRSITVTNEDGTFIPFATMDRVTVVPWIPEHHSEPDKPQDP